ncbi:MAG: hypothetical protein Q7T55_15100, partial [Solirubrobacteraceae bacterium]|nr:hypothetical protein [Solirubrobacteraceae bacterium]
MRVPLLTRDRCLRAAGLAALALWPAASAAQAAESTAPVAAPSLAAATGTAPVAAPSLAAATGAINGASG